MTLIETFEEGKYDLVLGTRYKDAAYHFRINPPWRTVEGGKDNRKSTSGGRIHVPFLEGALVPVKNDFLHGDHIPGSQYTTERMSI